MRTLVGAAEPEPGPVASGGIVATGPGLRLMTDGCITPVGGGMTVGPDVSVTVTFGPPSVDYLRSRIREPFRTTAHVGRPLPEIGA